MDDQIPEWTFLLENMSFIFTLDEREELRRELEKYSIKVEFYEKRGIQNSLFQGFTIYVQENYIRILAEMILLPVAKYGFVLLLKKVSAGIRKGMFSIKRPEIHFRSRIKHSDIYMKFPTQLADDEFDIYAERLHEELYKLKSRIEEDATQQDYLILSNSAKDSLNLQTMTIYEYLQGRLVNSEKKND